MKTRIHIVGAGFSGLTLALKLAEKGHPVSIYEKSDRVGGLLRTENTPNGLVEMAANAVIRTKSTVELFESLGIPQLRPLKSAKKRFIFRKDKPHAWPLTLFESASFFLKVCKTLTIKGKMGFRPLPNETLQNWGLRLFGPFATRFLLEPAMQGIYGSSIRGLSASIILGPLFSLKKSNYGGMLTGPNGMQDLVDQLQRRLLELNVEFNLNTQVDLSNITGPLVIATSASAASKLLANRNTELSVLLGKIPRSSLITATLFFQQQQDHYQGFGCLVPQGLGFKTLGILMNSYIFENRNKTYNETWILGGDEVIKLLQDEEKEILNQIAVERYQILKRKDSLIDYRITKWPEALPFYGLELEATLQKIDAVKSSDIFLHGNYLGGIGLSKILERSIQLSETITRTYG